MSCTHIRPYVIFSVAFSWVGGRMASTSKRRQTTSWTEDKKAELKRLWEWTDSTVIIGVLLKLRPNAVAVQASRMGLSRKPRGADADARARRPWTAEERRAALNAARTRRPLLDVAKELDRSLDALVRKLEDMMGKEAIEELILADTSLVLPPPPPRKGVRPAKEAGVSITIGGRPRSRPSGPNAAGYRQCPMCQTWRWSANAGDRFCDNCRKERTRVYA